MPGPSPLVAQLLLDAQDEFLRAAEHVPAPGRRRLGRLNHPGWVVAHAVTTHDSWMTVFARGGSFEECDPFCADWYQRQAAAGAEHPVEVDLGEALEAAGRVFARTTGYVEAYDEDALAAPVDTSGTPWAEWQITSGYMVARGVAHLFAHAGELSVIASLVRAGDLRLPGPLERSSAAATDAGGPLLAARLLLDARDELVRVAEALPAPARTAAFDRLNSGAFTLAHLADTDDTFWNQRVLKRDRDGWLRDLDLNAAERGEIPLPAPAFDDALEAYRRVCEGTAGTIEGLAADDLERVASESGRTVGAYLARSTAHTWAHAGELQAIGSLAGMGDLGLPGSLSRCAGPLRSEA